MPISEVEKFMKKFIKGFAVPKITNLTFYSGGKTFKFHIELGGLAYFEWNHIERETGFYMASFSKFKDYIRVVFSR